MSTLTNSPHILLALSRYDYRIHRSIAKFAAKNNWHLNCEMAITGRLPKDWQGDGIITMLSDNEELIDFVLNSNVPIVDLSIMRDDIPAHRVTADNPSIGKLAGEYFLARGYRHFAFYATTHNKVPGIRRDHYFQTVQKHAQTILDWSISGTKDDWEQKISTLKQHLLASPLPIAVFAANDPDASIVLDACLKADLKVPEQVAILGVDNNTLITESLQVPLSSINHDVERLGYEGAQLLQQLILKKNVDNTVKQILPTGITTRRSTDYLAVNDELVKNALNYMELHYSNAKFSVDKIAEYCQVSRRTLDKRFKTQLDHSTHVELNNMRLRAANKLLIESQQSVLQISNDCGFNTPQYFNLIFRQHIGITPLAYRKKFQ
jgi:LacI family transcriptional regulator